MKRVTMWIPYGIVFLPHRAQRSHKAGRVTVFLITKKINGLHLALCPQCLLVKFSGKVLSLAHAKTIAPTLLFYFIFRNGFCANHLPG